VAGPPQELAQGEADGWPAHRRLVALVRGAAGGDGEPWAHRFAWWLAWGTGTPGADDALRIVRACSLEALVAAGFTDRLLSLLTRRGAVTDGLAELAGILLAGGCPLTPRQREFADLLVLGGRMRQGTVPAAEAADRMKAALARVDGVPQDLRQWLVTGYVQRVARASADELADPAALRHLADGADGEALERYVAEQVAPAARERRVALLLERPEEAAGLFHAWHTARRPSSRAWERAAAQLLAEVLGAAVGRMTAGQVRLAGSELTARHPEHEQAWEDFCDLHRGAATPL